MLMTERDHETSLSQGRLPFDLFADRDAAFHERRRALSSRRPGASWRPIESLVGADRSRG
jgi:hypothetical protein